MLAVTGGDGGRCLTGPTGDSVTGMSRFGGGWRPSGGQFGSFQLAPQLPTDEKYFFGRFLLSFLWILFTKINFMCKLQICESLLSTSTD